MQRLIVLILLAASVLSQSTTTCTMRSTYIPESNMAGFVSRYVDAVTPDDALVNLITNPSADTAIAYSKTLMPIVIPIFAFAVIAIIFMMVACIQICCVGCCNSVRCKCTSYTFTSMKWLMGFVILFLLLLIGGGIAGMLFNHDTLATSVNTGCVAGQIFNTLINGDNSANWNGLANLTPLAQNISINFANNINSLNTYFNSSVQTQLANLLPAGTTYQNVYALTTCTAPNSAVTCPNSTDSSC